MGKNIVVCCDGTGNQFGGNNTNVVKLFGALDLSDPSRQVALYDPGVGTGNPREAITRTRRLLGKVAGLAFGFGIYRNIADVYKYLMREYNAGDRVYVFGYSRGAYTARALAGLIAHVGLLRPGNDNLVPYALELYRKRVPKSKPKKTEHYAVANGFKKTFSRPCEIHFMGVWDTVKTVGLWDALKISTRLGTSLPHTFSMSGVRSGRHAMAIHERRSRFRPNLWGRPEDQNMQQVWFPGVHSDVGGGGKSRGLADIALNWMLVGAERQGLLVDAHVYGDLAPKPTTEPENNLIPAWWILGWYRRTIRGPGKWDDDAGQFARSPPRVHESAKGHRWVPDDAILVGDDWDSYVPLEQGTEEGG